MIVCIVCVFMFVCLRELCYLLCVSLRLCIFASASDYMRELGMCICVFVYVYVSVARNMPEV